MDLMVITGFCPPLHSRLVNFSFCVMLFSTLLNKIPLSVLEESST